MFTYEEMNEKNMRDCARLAAEAFFNYEYFKIYIPKPQRRRRFLDALIQCEFKANRNLDTVKFFTVREGNKLLAVAQLCSPNFEKPDDVTYIKSGWTRALLRGGIGDVNAWNAMEKEASAPCHHLKGNVWYLSLLTVCADSKGKGVGTAFLHECLIPFVKSKNAEALSLFTNSEINRKFYLKNGFEEFDEKHFSYRGSALGSWSYIMKF